MFDLAFERSVNSPENGEAEKDQLLYFRGDLGLGRGRFRLGCYGRLPFDGFFKASKTFAQSFAQLGKLTGSEEQKRDYQDDYEMCRCK